MKLCETGAPPALPKSRSPIAKKGVFSHLHDFFYGEQQKNGPAQNTGPFVFDTSENVAFSHCQKHGYFFG